MAKTKARLKDKKKIALVLSGGGVKAAAFHLGVCLALQEKGFRFAGGTPENVSKNFADDSMTIKTYVGSSAGAVISAFLAAGYSVDGIIEAFQVGTKLSERLLRKKKNSDPGRLKAFTYFHIFHLNGRTLINLMPKIGNPSAAFRGGLEALLKSGFKINGLFTTKGLERYLRKHVLQDNRFSSLGAELYIVATQLNHSRKVVFGSYEETHKVDSIKYANFATISEAVAASASLPPVFAPFGIKNQKGKELYFFDGEIRDTLSTHVAADHGADLVISSYSIQPYHYNETVGSLHKYGIPIIANQALYQVIEQKIQKHMKHKKDIASVYNAIDGYCRQAGISDADRKKLLQIVRERVDYRPNVDYMYIHPSPNDHDMFFADHFSLSPEILEKIVRTGFKSAIATLRRYNF